jgi:hypothetical protein
VQSFPPTIHPNHPCSPLDPTPILQNLKLHLLLCLLLLLHPCYPKGWPQSRLCYRSVRDRSGWVRLFHSRPLSGRARLGRPLMIPCLLRLYSIFAGILQGIVIPQIPKMTIKDRKVVSVGITNLLTHSQAMTAEPFAKTWYVVFAFPSRSRLPLTTSNNPGPIAHCPLALSLLSFRLVASGQQPSPPS